MKKQEDIFIHTAKMNFNMSDKDFQNALSLVTKEEQRAIILKKNHKSRCQLLSSTLLVKKTIRDTLDLSESCFKIKRSNMSRPYIETNKKVQVDFNISHSNEWIVCAISLAGKVGIDIEKIVPIDINLAREFLSYEEWKYLYIYGGKKVKLFYKFWTLKESFLKAIGVGINDSIRKINFGALNGKNNIFEREINGYMWNFYHDIFDQNYSLSVACSKSIKSIRFNNYQNLYKFL